MANLLQYILAEAPNFVWGSWKGEQFCKKIDDCYDEMVTWKRNIFKVPSGKQGQAFVKKSRNFLMPLPRLPLLNVLPSKLPGPSILNSTKKHLASQKQKTMSAVLSEE